MTRNFFVGSLLLALAGSAYGAVSITTGANYGTFSAGPVQSQLIATGGVAPYVWTVTAGALPTGTFIRADNPSYFNPLASAGIIGFATAPGTSTFTLQVKDSTNATAIQVGTIVVTALTMLDPPSLSDGFKGASYSRTFTTAGATGAVTFTLNGGSTLPAGLSLSVGGVLSGVPTAAGNFSFNINATDTTGTVSQGFNLNIFGVGFSGSPSLGPVTIGSPITAIPLTGSGGTAAYSFSGFLPSGLSLSSSGQITGTPTGNNGTYTFSATITDATAATYSRNYAITYVGGNGGNLPAMGYPNPAGDATLGQVRTYNLSVFGGVAPYTWSATGLTGTGFYLRTTDLSPNLRGNEVEFAGAGLALGTINAVVSVKDSSTPPITTTQTVQIKVVAMTSDGLPNGTRGVAYNSALRVIGGAPPYNFQLVGGTLPAPLTVDPLTGVISGIPAENGNFGPLFTVTSSVASGAITMTRSLGLSIGTSTSPQISINLNSPGDALVNSNYIQLMNACCVAGTLTWTVSTGTLPAGLTLTSSNGVISGTPTAAGTFPFTVQATESANTANFGLRQFSIVVSPLNVTVNLPNAVVGTGYSQTQTVTGGGTSYTWTLAGAAPPGLALSAGGTLSGTPTSAGSYGLTFVVTDNLNNKRTVGANLSIYDPGSGPTLTSTIAPNTSLGLFTLGTQQIALTANGGTGTYAWSITSGTLPPGLVIRTDVPSLL